MKVRKLRLLRIKHGIQLDELGTEVGLTKQRISALELGDGAVTKQVEDKMRHAFSNILFKQRVSCQAFNKDIERHKDSLFELVEDSYDL